MGKRKDPIDAFFTYFDTLGDEAQQLVASILMTKVKKRKAVVAASNPPGKSQSPASSARHRSSTSGATVTANPTTQPVEGVGGVSGGVGEEGRVTSNDN